MTEEDIKLLKSKLKEVYETNLLVEDLKARQSIYKLSMVVDEILNELIKLD